MLEASALLASFLAPSAPPALDVPPTVEARSHWHIKAQTQPRCAIPSFIITTCCRACLAVPSHFRALLITTMGLKKVLTWGCLCPETADQSYQPLQLAEEVRLVVGWQG